MMHDIIWTIGLMVSGLLILIISLISIWYISAVIKYSWAVFRFKEKMYKPEYPIRGRLALLELILRDPITKGIVTYEINGCVFRYDHYEQKVILSESKE